jgi:hypothetical protein
VNSNAKMEMFFLAHSADQFSKFTISCKLQT